MIETDDQRRTRIRRWVHVIARARSGQMAGDWIDEFADLAEVSMADIIDAAEAMGIGGTFSKRSEPR
jgi:hypothetical protein